MRVSVEPGESSVRVSKNGAEVGVARPGAEISEALNAGDSVTLEAFDEPVAEEAEGENTKPAADEPAQTGGAVG